METSSSSSLMCRREGVTSFHFERHCLNILYLIRCDDDKSSYAFLVFQKEESVEQPEFRYDEFGFRVDKEGKIFGLFLTLTLIVLF